MSKETTVPTPGAQGSSRLSMWLLRGTLTSRIGAARGRRIYAYLSILPALLIVALFTFYPVLYNVVLAVHRNVLTQPGNHPFVGLQNFLDVVSNPYFLRALTNTAQYTVVTVAGVAVCGILVALLLNERFFGAKVLQVLILIPWAIPPVMAGIIWRWLFAGNVGVINGLMYSLGLIEDYISFFGNPNTAKMALVIARLWVDLPLATILFLAALQVIPRELYDVVKIDGGARWATFRYVTLPYLRSTLVLVLALQTLISLVTFELVYVMTGGGPANATMLVAWYAYTEIFTNLNLGRGAAMAFILALITLILAVFYFRALRSDEIY